MGNATLRDYVLHNPILFSACSHWRCSLMKGWSHYFARFGTSFVAFFNHSSSLAFFILSANGFGFGPTNINTVPTGCFELPERGCARIPLFVNIDISVCETCSARCVNSHIRRCSDTSFVERGAASKFTGANLFTSTVTPDQKGLSSPDRRVVCSILPF